MPSTRKPTELNTHDVTRTELAAIVEHMLYRADGKMRASLAGAMPSAYQRLMGIDDATLAMLTHKRVRSLREAGSAHVAHDPTYQSPQNGHLLKVYADSFGVI